MDFINICNEFQSVNKELHQSLTEAVFYLTVLRASLASDSV